MEPLAWAIVFTVALFDYRNAEKEVLFGAYVAVISVTMLFLLTVLPWLPT